MRASGVTACHRRTNQRPKAVEGFRSKGGNSSDKQQRALQGVAKGDDTKSVDETLDSKQPLTPSVPITARRATERGEGNRVERGKAMEEPRYQQVNRFVDLREMVCNKFCLLSISYGIMISEHHDAVL